MPYFVKGKPTISKPTSLLGSTLQVLGRQQQLDMMEKRDRQRMMLQAAQMKMQQEKALLQYETAKEKSRLADERRLDTQQSMSMRELRRIQDVNLEPWAEDLFDQVVRGQLAAANNFRGSLEDSNAALDNVIAFRKMLEKDKDFNKNVEAFNTMLDPLEQQNANKKLKENFQQVDTDNLGIAVERANFLAGGGFANNMRVIGADDLSMVPQLVGNEFTGFDEEGNPQYADILSEVTKSPYYHDQGKTGFMVTPMKPFFGRSYSDIGFDVSKDLKHLADNGPWKEDDARSFVGDLLRTPFGTRGREWRMRSLLGNVTGPEANEQSEGIYYKYADNPELRDQLMKMVLDYDISGPNGLKPLYLEYRTDIDNAIQLAEDKIVAASDFDNYQAPLRSGGRRSPDNPQIPFNEQMTNYRARLVEEETGAVGSQYSPYFLRSNQQKATMDNSAAQAEWDAQRQEALLEKVQGHVDQGRDEDFALQMATEEINKLYKPSDRPDDTIDIPIRRLAVFPDATDENGNAALFLLDNAGKRYPVLPNSQAYTDIEAEINGKTYGKVTIADLLNDMDLRWQYPDSEPVTPAATQPAAPASTPPQTQQTVEVNW